MIRVALYQATPYAKMLRYALDNTDGFNVVASFLNVASMAKELHRCQPDVLLANTALPNGSEIIASLRRSAIPLKIVVLTDAEEFTNVMENLLAGVDGYLLIRRTPLLSLIECIRAAMNGGFPMDPILMNDVLAVLLRREREKHVTKNRIEELTTREKDVLQLLVRGLSYKDISVDLNISLDTVRSHIKRIYEKLRVRSKSEAVLRVLGESTAPGISLRC